VGKGSCQRRLDAGLIGRKASPALDLHRKKVWVSRFSGAMRGRGKNLRRGKGFSIHGREMQRWLLRHHWVLRKGASKGDLVRPGVEKRVAKKEKGTPYACRRSRS